MAGIDQPPRNGQFGKESDWERSEILGDPDDMDTELAALVEKAEHASEVRDNVAFWINNMLEKHGVNTIYQLGLSDEESSKREDAVFEVYRQDVENGDFSKLDISALDECRGDELALAEAIDLQLQVYIEKRIASEMFVMMCVSTELDSQRVMDGTEKTDMIADHLLVLDETSHSPWFGFLNEALGGEDVSPEQVERVMDAQTTANKTGDPYEKSREFYDRIFMETGGGLSAVQTALVAYDIAGLAMKEMTDQASGGEYAYCIEKLQSIGLSDEQITTLIAAYKEIMRRPPKAEE
ncbi:hypothetical protein GWK78_00375 [Candidatus Saccharibacteria bacterium oral taxon 488]|nr:hypothetical protein GWK78_00375 [Candidatus Saccharibacteria bacterium oral taxon 488]